MRRWLRFALSFCNLERGVSDFYSDVEDQAFGRFGRTVGLCVKSCLNERNHFVSVANMQIRLDGAETFRARYPTSRRGNVPGVAEWIGDDTPAIAGGMVIVRWVNGCGTGLECASVGGMGIWHIEMCRH